MMNEDVKLSTENTEEEIYKGNVETQSNEEKADATMTTDNETPVQGKSEDFIDKALDIWDRIKLCCYFVPILTTVSYGLAVLFDASDFIASYIMLPMMIIGWVATVLTGPFRLIKLIWKWISFGWKAFWIIPVYPICLMLGCMGAVLCFAGIAYILMFIPAAVTIYYFVTEEMY